MDTVLKDLVYKIEGFGEKPDFIIERFENDGYGRYSLSVRDNRTPEAGSEENVTPDDDDLVYNEE